MQELNILEKIIVYKKEEVWQRKRETPVAVLEKNPFFTREVFSLKKFLADPARTGIIAEFKRRSPSKGVIHATAAVEAVTAAYARYGAAAISVLTDTLSFGGSTEDLMKARANPLPLLRKDFMIDEYQIVEARAMGADAILLIAACLTPAKTKKLASFAKGLGLETLLEIHQESELSHDGDEIDVVGINNRDLKTFTVDINRSIALAQRLPENKMLVAESGIRDVETLCTLKSAGFNGFLIGEQFMKEPDPAIAFASFVDHLKRKLHESKSLRHDATRSGKED
ncbi:MAG: indole-3-glycerol phosphate synthase TrpC [Bacteroidota bacterium]|nr:indole-3-glycerol phosphate synthase TrpC [Bacteroidota bacterium]MDP4211920.1 indole-3-glycerol phosphate synthase TrpC [Bacteroidota bacterium]MDP4249275.1 indole-3-glycerol phosphate synthase TrpC [Bacteroidota bacterium]